MVIAEVVSHKERLILIDSIVIRHKIVNEIHHSLLQSNVEGLIDILVAHKALKEVQAALVLDKAALAFKIVSLNPSCKAAEDGVLEREAFFSVELPNKIESTTLGGKLLHLPIVRHDRSQEMATSLAHPRTLMREYQT